MTMAKKYNWGLIGTGWIAHEMANALQAVNGEIYAASSPNQAELEKFVKEKQVSKAYLKADDLINDDQVDIVYVATPHTYHYEYMADCKI